MAFNKKVIKTVHKRGYQFIAELSRDSVSEAPVPEQKAGTNPDFVSYSDKPSIAVLPFENLSDDPEQEYFSDGITEDITTELSRFRELFVIARNSSLKFKQTTIETRKVAEKLGVQYVVEGSVR